VACAAPLFHNVKEFLQLSVDGFSSCGDNNDLALIRLHLVGTIGDGENKMGDRDLVLVHCLAL
jgi:hypothetical protein